MFSNTAILTAPVVSLIVVASTTSAATATADLGVDRIAEAGATAAMAMSVKQPALTQRAVVQQPAVRAAVVPQVLVDATGLASIRRLMPALIRRQDVLSEGELVAAWTDVSLVLASVTGAVDPPALAFHQMRDAMDAAAPVWVRAGAGAGQRDEAADRLLALGYSARETADVLGRRISQHALDAARRMIAAGGNRQVAANYLDRQYRRVLEASIPRLPPTRRQPAPATFDALIEKYAALHNVEAAVVRAIMATESAFNPSARSSAGAIGLMQLMPGTARELGVNPLVPEENIEGGVRYFAQLFKMFGKLDLALVAYNAGPGFAERYARGKTGLYGETRDYVARVLGRLAGRR